MLNRTYFSSMMFEAYVGYILFEIGLLFITYRSVTAFFTDQGLRILLVHHLIAGVASYSIATSSDPRPHYLGMLNLGNECVVISYSLIVVFRKFGMNKHWFVGFNVMMLTVQYALRQLLFLYSFYYVVINMETLLASGALFYWGLTAGIGFFTLVLNPYWLYETIIDANKYRKIKQAEN